LHTSIFARFNPALRVEAISIEERASQYQTFPSVFALNPLTGVGPGAYVFALERISKGQPSWSYQPMHNVFLLILAELGTVGFGAFGYFLFEIGRVVFAYRKTTGGIFAVSFFMALLILGSFDHYLFSLWPGLALLVLVLALCMRIVERETKTA
jgi:O-antigen ligase